MWIAGVDEAGRGPLAGQVVAAAVILYADQTFDGLTDSKKLSEPQRAHLETLIKQNARCWSVAEASVEEIDRLNILQATLLAMKRAILQLEVTPDMTLIDGNRVPNLPNYSIRSIVKGDLSEPCISAASILAKQHRDRCMRDIDAAMPQYQFARHKGYPTRLHMQLLREHSVSAVHRRSFKPVRELL